MKRNEPSTKITVMLPDRVLDALRGAADDERRSLTATLVVAAEAYLRTRGGGSPTGSTGVEAPAGAAPWGAAPGSPPAA